MATLDDLKGVLESIDISINSQSSLLTSMLDIQNRALIAQETRNRLSSVDTTVTSGQGSPSGAGPSPLSAGLGAAAVTAGGLIGMGAGIAGFMAALSVGSMGLDWLGNDYSGLSEAFASFSSAITQLTPAAMAALAAAATIASTTSSFKNLYGLGTASGMVGFGAGISGFLIGLAIGDIGLGWINNDYSNLGDAFASFSEAITQLTPAAVTAIASVAGIATAQAAFGIDPKDLILSMTGIGIGIAGFLTGLAIGDIGLGWINNDYSNLGNAFASFSEAITQLTPAAATAIASVAGIATVTAAFGVDPKDIIKSMGGIAAGIAAFLGGLVLADVGLDWLAGISGADGSALKSAFKLFNDSVGELKDPTAITALGLIIAAGTAAGIAKGTEGISAAVGITATMTGIGAGIAGFMIGLTAGGIGIDWIDKASGLDSGALVGAFKVFNDSVGALNNENAIKALAAIIGVGGGIGAIVGAINPALAGAAGLGIFAIMTGIGAGIAGLFIGLAAGGKIVDIIESIPGGDGDGLVSVFKMFNNTVLAITPEAVERLKDISTLGGLNIGDALKQLSAGALAMFGAGGLTSIGSMINDGLKNTVDYIFGTDYASEAKPSIFQQLVDGLEPIKGFDIAPVNEFVNTLDTLTSAFERLANVDVSDGIQKNIFSMMKNIGGVMGMMPFLLRGGEYTGKRLGWGDNIDFGPEGEGGLLALRDEDLDLLKQQIGKLYGALDIPSANMQGENSVATLSAAAAESQLVSITAENVRIETENATISKFQAQAEVLKGYDMDRRSQVNMTDASDKSVNTEYKAGPTYVSNNILQPSHTKGDLDYYFGN